MANSKAISSSGLAGVNPGRLITSNPLVTLSLILFLALPLRLIEFTRPFYGHHDFHAAFYTLGGAGRRMSEYTNWPPLTDWLYGASLFLFGQEEWAVRVIPVLLSLGTIFVVYLLAKDLFDVETGLLAALFLTIIPAEIYFARIETFHFFIPLTIWSYYRWVVTRQPIYLGLAVGSNLVGLGFSYSAVLLAGLPNLYLAIRHRDWRGQAVMIGATLAALAAWFGYLWTSGSSAGPQNAAKDDNITQLLSADSLRAWLDVAGFTTRTLFTPVLLILSVMWLLALPIKRNAGDMVLLLWGLAAFGWLLLAPEHSKTHDMWWLILAAPLVVVAARGVLNLAASGPAKWAPVIVVLAMTTWFAIDSAPYLFEPRSPTATVLGQGISEYLDEDDAIVADTPVEIWYSGANGYLWSYFHNVAGEEGFRQVLAEERPAMIVPQAGDLLGWEFRYTWEAGYIPLLTSGDKLVYFQKDKADTAAARDAAMAATVNAARTLPDGSLVRGSDGSPDVYFLKWGLKLPAPDSVTLELIGVSDDEVVVVDSRVLDAVLEGPIIPFLREGTLIKGFGPEVYVLSGGERRLISDPATFAALGFSREDTVPIVDDLLERIPAGAPYTVAVAGATFEP